MCGICGIVDFQRPPEVSLVEAMCSSLAHRGPDGQAIYHDGVAALGHRRLAIIDLSDGGIQPFASPDGALQLVHNGEIFNYIELRSELERKGHRFRTATDTEVLLAAYEEWGVRCTERFNGMWAFALWDARRQTLFCSRDRVGVKPLYYRFERGRFVFASELKAFCALGPTVANDAAIRDYLEQGFIDHTNDTFFAGIHSLAPAHSLLLNESGMRFDRYWSLEPREAQRNVVDEFRELFFDSIRLRLRSDVPLGTALSGGLDSSAVACTTSHLLHTGASDSEAVGARQRTFTAYFEDSGFDERPYAEQVVSQIGADAHWVSFDDRELVDVLPSIVYSQDEPFGSTSIVAQWFVMREARRAGIRVMLDGQGGDEILAGYPVYRGARLADLLASGRLSQLAREVSVSSDPIFADAVAVARPFLPEALKWRLRARATGAGKLVGTRLRGVRSAANFDRGPYTDRFGQSMFRMLTQQGLPELLHYEDRNSMAHSIEARVPFLDYRLIELMFSARAEDLFGGGMTKMTLRKALADILPPAVRDRRDKLGFVTPGARFLRGALGAFAADVFASDVFKTRGYVDDRAAQALLERHRAGDVDASQPLWRALNLELWARTYLDSNSVHSV